MFAPATDTLARDGIETVWIPREQICGKLRELKSGIDRPYRMLYDLTAIDERDRENRAGEPDVAFAVMYHLYSFERNEYLRVKTPLAEDGLSL
jgi:NADH-quinone oxidoreductase subunit C/D